MGVLFPKSNPNRELMSPSRKESKLHILINNAGVRPYISQFKFFPPLLRTEQTPDNVHTLQRNTPRYRDPIPNKLLISFLSHPTPPANPPLHRTSRPFIYRPNRERFLRRACQTRSQIRNFLPRSKPQEFEHVDTIRTF